VNIAFLGQLAALLNPALASSFVAATLKELVNALVLFINSSLISLLVTGYCTGYNKPFTIFLQGGTAGAKRLWVMSNISLDSILPGVDINAFVEQHKVCYLTC